MSPDRLGENPFHVLGVEPRAGARDIERAAQRWLAMLGVGLEEARRYPTPLGWRARDEDAVRQAVEALRDPTRRALFEQWAVLPPDPEAELAPPDPLEPWPDALRAFGWVDP